MIRFIIIGSFFFNFSTSPQTARAPSGRSGLYYILQWQLITPSYGQKHCKTAEKRPIFQDICRLQMVSESRDF